MEVKERIQNLPDTDDAFCFRRVTYEETRKTILNLRNDCSTGPDQIPSKYLKICVDSIASPICHIINTSIDNKIFPRQWKISKITPIPKVDHPNEPSDYRPISILAALSKVFENLMMKQVSEHLERENLLSIHQSGFRKGHCTITSCTKLKNDIVTAMHRGEITLAVMADFSKAFDTVDYESLITKLHQLKFSKASMYLLANYLSSRRQFTQVNDNVSQELTVTNGVPQGSILGPILFNIYVSDMSRETDAELIQYADDTSVYRSCKPKMFDQCVTKMNEDVSKVQSWSKNSSLIFNAKKTNSILFSTKQMAKHHEFKYEIFSTDGSQIKQTSEFKLLGVTFREDLKWNSHINKATSSSFGTLKTLAHLKRFLSFKLRKQLAEILVLSKLDCGNAIYHGAPTYLMNQLQRVQNAAASFVRSRYSKINDVVGLKWLPVQERAEFSISKLAWKSINSDDWPKFLPMQQMKEPVRPSRRQQNDGIKIACMVNVANTFEYEASKIFNNLPGNCRNAKVYSDFCKNTKSYLLDKSLARSLA